MSSYDFVHWNGLPRLVALEQDVDTLKGQMAPALADIQTALSGGAATAPMVFSHSGAATTGTGAARYPIAISTTIHGVIATAGTAPTGQALIFDVNKNGTTIFTTQANRPQIAAGANQIAALAVPDVTSVSTNDYITVDIDQVGSSVAGADLVVLVVFA